VSKPKVKWYAVAVGRKSGIYTSWDNAKLQVDGFKGAVFKSFKSELEAEVFMKAHNVSWKQTSTSAVGRAADEFSASTSLAASCPPTTPSKKARRASDAQKNPHPDNDELQCQESTENVKASTSSVPAPGALTCYTDGSHRPGRESAGWGVVVVQHGWSKLRRREDPNARLVSELWGPVVLDASNTDNGSFFLGAERATNNTGELCAVGEALLWLNDFEGTTRPVMLRPDSTYAEKVTTGENNAQANLKLVARVRAEYKRALKLRNGNVKFHHVDAHKGHVWNERADELAFKGTSNSFASVGRWGSPLGPGKSASSLKDTGNNLLAVPERDLTHVAHRPSDINLSSRKKPAPKVVSSAMLGSCRARSLMVQRAFKSLVRLGRVL